MAHRPRRGTPSVVVKSLGYDANVSLYLPVLTKPGWAVRVTLQLPRPDLARVICHGHVRP